MTIHQISVFLENRIGQLSEITEVLAAAKIDLRAIHIAETTDYGVLRLIADDGPRAASVLLEHGFVLSMTPVVAVAVKDQPGGLAGLLRIFAEEGIDIEYMYSVFGETDGMAYMIFRVAEPEKLSAALAGHGVREVSGADMGLR